MGTRQKMLLMALAFAGLASGAKRSYVPDEPVEVNPYNKKNRDKAHGLKEFTIKGVTVMALNEKNAIKKVNKILAKR